MPEENTAQLRTLDRDRAASLERICELIVPGSARVGPVLYIDALLTEMSAAQRDHMLTAIDELGELARDGAQALAGRAATPAFLGLRALAIEAFYSDFVAPGIATTSAWEEIDFRPPLAARLRKDWSYLGIDG